MFYSNLGLLGHPLYITDEDSKISQTPYLLSLKSENERKTKLYY